MKTNTEKVDTTIAEIRRRNLKLLIAEFDSPLTGRGGQAEITRRAKLGLNYLSQIVNRCRKSNGDACVCGTTLARRIEEACDKPPGWLDVDQNDKSETELLNLFNQMDDEMRDLLLSHAKLIVRKKS